MRPSRLLIAFALPAAACACADTDAPVVSNEPVAGGADLGVCGGGDLVTVATVENRHGEVLAAHVGASGMVGVASEDQTLKFWDARTGELAGAVEGFMYMPAFEVGSDLTAVAVDRTGALAASGESTGRVAVWRVENSELVQAFGDAEAPVLAGAFAPGGGQVASADASFGGAVGIRDIDSGTTIAAGDGNLWEVAHLAFSPEGESVAVTGHIYGSPAVDVISSAFPTASMGLWESLDLQIEHGRIGARAAAWSPDGSRVVVVGDRFAAVLDVERRSSSFIEEATALALFDDHDPVDVSVDPTGAWITTVGAEGDLRFHTLEDLAPLGGTALGEPVAVGLAAEASRVAAVHRDGTVELLACAE